MSAPVTAETITDEERRERRVTFDRLYAARFPGGCRCYHGGNVGTCECLDLEDEVDAAYNAKHAAAARRSP